MKKVLIWNADIPFINAGGPGGYLYNIREFLKDNPCSQIFFLSDSESEASGVKIIDKKRERIKNTFRRSGLFAIIFDLRQFINLYKKKELSYSIDINEYDFIHFHNIISVIRYRSYIEHYNGKLLLTTHMPEPPISEFSYSFKKLGPFIRKHQEFIIRKELNIIRKFKPIWIFPAKDALEPYVNLSQTYKEYFDSIKEEIRFIPTCILDIEIKRRKDFFGKYNIPNDAFIINYIGRHNEIKGYHILKKIAEKILSAHNNVYFVIAGKEEPLKGLNHDHWIELGWINNSQDIIANSNLFILPNQQTYFDLIFIEVLRAGTAILATYTGGNKFFDRELDKQETKGISYYDAKDVDGAVIAIERLLQQDTNMLGKQNRMLWEKRFNIREFVNRYISLINGL